LSYYYISVAIGMGKSDVGWNDVEGRRVEEIVYKGYMPG
jgi:hypothetical protein